MRAENSPNCAYVGDIRSMAMQFHVTLCPRLLCRIDRQILMTRSTATVPASVKKGSKETDRAHQLVRASSHDSLGEVNTASLEPDPHRTIPETRHEEANEAS